uniref:Membrane protein US8A n=1 Tax=Macrostomum lignano TaxID=282301 RepID=A0A1I8FTH7_9PLAT
MFYTLNKGTEARVMKAKAGLFKQRHSSSFRFSGRSQKELLSNSDYFLNINHTAPGFVRELRPNPHAAARLFAARVDCSAPKSSRNSPRIRRLRSVRSPSLSDGSDGEEFSSLSHSRREQAQADGRGQTDSRYALFLGARNPRRRRRRLDVDAATNSARRRSCWRVPLPPPAMTASSWCTISTGCRAGGDLESGIENTIAEEAEAEAEAEAAAAEDVFRDKDVDSGVAEETIVSTAAAAAVLPNNHDGEADEAFSELDKVLDQVDGQAQAGGDKPDRLADKTAVQRPPSRSRCPRLRALFLLSIGFSLLAVLGAVVLFELGEPPEPLRWLRSHPVAHDVHERFYAPARTRLMEIGRLGCREAALN